MTESWIWRPALASAIVLLACPTLGLIRRSAARRIPAFRRHFDTRPPWWTYVLCLLGVPLLFIAARELDNGDGGRWLYLFGAAMVSAVL